MKRFHAVSLLALLFAAQANSLFASDTILVFHPTAENIKTILYLHSNLFEKKSAEDFIYLGVYHENEMYDYSESVEYLAQHSQAASLFKLRKITGRTELKDVFSKNAWTNRFTSLFEASVGAIFLGGPDMPPAIYGSKQSLLTDVTDPYRHYMEISALFHLLGSSKNEAFKPYLQNHPSYSVLGICLGMQSMNVATGGSLIQDLPTTLYGLSTREDILNDPQHSHRNYYFDDPEDSIELTGYHFHPVAIEDFNSLVGEAAGKSTVMVLSSHHQCVEKPGKGLVPVAWSTDHKIVEAVKHESYPNVVGVQFHPEKTELFLGDTLLFVSPDSTLNFNQFIIENDAESFHRDFWRMLGKMFGGKNFSE